MNRPKVIAHRGGRRSTPENTMAAFAHALELGVDGIELDVQRCSTGELVIFHDEDINRTTNGVGLIKDISWDELQRLDAGGWFDPKFAGEKIPSLEQLLDLAAGRCEINIELKNAPIDYPDIEDDLLALLEAHPNQTVCISSFDHKLLQRVARLAPHLKIALLADGIFTDLGAMAKQVNAKYWHPSYESLRADAVGEAHELGLEVNPWTINNPRHWLRAIQDGVDGIITDDPENLIQMLERRRESMSQLT